MDEKEKAIKEILAKKGLLHWQIEQLTEQLRAVNRQVDQMVTKDQSATREKVKSESK